MTTKTGNYTNDQNSSYGPRSYGGNDLTQQQQQQQQYPPQPTQGDKQYKRYPNQNIKQIN